MLGPLSFIPMGKQEDEPAEPLPLECGAGDELVDDDLGAVDKVPELGLPEGQFIGICQTLAKLEPKRSVLGQGAVDDLILGGPGVPIQGIKFLTRFHIVENRVTV